MFLEHSGLVFDASGRPAEERVAVFGSLSALDSGSLLCGFQLGRHKNGPESALRFCRSDDGGTTWQELPARFDTTYAGVSGFFTMSTIVEVVPGKLLLLANWWDHSDPERPLFDPDTEGILHSRQLRAYSTDEGRSWSCWEEIPTPDFAAFGSCPPVLTWSDGTLAYPLENHKRFDDLEPAPSGAWLLVSHDGGRTFDDPLLVARHPQDKVNYWDQRLCIGPGRGEFIAMFWTHDRQQKKDLAVHLRRASIYDDGFGKAPITATGIPGQIAAPLLLEDGRLLAFVVNRGKPATMTLWQSKDGGVSWPLADALVVYTHEEHSQLSHGADKSDYAQVWEDIGKWSFGHPSICPLGEGRVLLTFYAGTPDCMSIHWARVNTGSRNRSAPRP